MITSTNNPNARGLGDANLLQSYFACVTESKNTTLIEYGKTLGTTESGDIYLNMLDTSQRLKVRFYAFGNGDRKLDVTDAHIVSRDLTQADCKGDTYMDLETRLCTQRCHEDCDPLQGNDYQKYPIPTFYGTVISHPAIKFLLIEELSSLLRMILLNPERSLSVSIPRIKNLVISSGHQILAFASLATLRQ